MKADVDNARLSLRYFRKSLDNVEEELEAMQVSLVKVRARSPQIDVIDLHVRNNTIVHSMVCFFAGREG